ncbi:hypothetical protein BGZ50_000923 [Haplosporangium sp. Z 11]|nr:hypothetical protein BGZ50_000923 [Haplosporangium sp. Z 11]
MSKTNPIVKVRVTKPAQATPTPKARTKPLISAYQMKSFPEKNHAKSRSVSKRSKMGLQNSRKIKIYPRKLEVIEKVLPITFQEEMVKSKFMLRTFTVAAL